MKKLIILLILLVTVITAAFSQNKYIAKEATIMFFSKTSVENIFATNKAAASVIDFDKNVFAFSVPIKSFIFEKALMQEHFNENYMESSKYPNGSFKGKIEGKYDLLKDGEYEVNAVGTLDIHGVKQERTIPAKIIVKAGVISIKSNFKIKLVDHKIEVPSVVNQNIAETIDVSVQGVMEKAKK
jgi:polyisoprenoid-binding protein YceI